MTVSIPVSEDPRAVGNDEAVLLIIRAYLNEVRESDLRGIAVIRRVILAPQKEARRVCNEWE